MYKIDYIYIHIYIIMYVYGFNLAQGSVIGFGTSLSAGQGSFKTSCRFTAWQPFQGDGGGRSWDMILSFTMGPYAVG